MKKLDWRVRLGCGLVLLSAALYAAHWVIFRDAHHIFIYLLGDIAFVPVDVLIVTLIIHGLLSLREKRALLNKMNMVIGSFYSEVGTKLLGGLRRFAPETDKLTEDLRIRGDWNAKRFAAARARLRSHDYPIKARPEDLEELRTFLLEKRTFLLGLLQNPNLLEHDSFTDLLWAVFHLTDELAHRRDLSQLPASDIAHLEGDIKRVCAALICEWMDYMRHLKGSYPYLFSLATRTNPFDPEAAPEVA